MLAKNKRIALEMPCLEWIHKALELTYTQVISLTPSIAAESCFLPGDFHEDPADCLIVSTARIENLVILTRDTHILKYSEKKYISVIQT